MKTQNLNPEVELACFRDALGGSFAKVCADIKSELGRLDKDVVSKSTGWKVLATKGAIESKEGHKLFLPLNAGWPVLLRFGMQLTAIATNGSSDAPKYSMNIQAELPFECKEWFARKYQTASQKGVGEGAALEVPAVA